MKDAGAVDPSQCYFVDDSASNIDAAQVNSLSLSFFNDSVTY